jgi:hypothetical protein
MNKHINIYIYIYNNGNSEMEHRNWPVSKYFVPMDNPKRTLKRNWQLCFKVWFFKNYKTATFFSILLWNTISSLYQLLASGDSFKTVLTLTPTLKVQSFPLICFHLHNTRVILFHSFVFYCVCYFFILGM